MVKECCDCCDKKETVKVYFCPKCGSKEVGFVFRFGNAFGVIPKMECKKCKFNGSIFPLLVVDKESLNKANAHAGIRTAVQKKISKKRGKKK